MTGSDGSARSPAEQTRLRPSLLARYMALSAASSNGSRVAPCTGQVATPEPNTEVRLNIQVAKFASLVLGLFTQMSLVFQGHQMTLRSNSSNSSKIPTRQNGKQSP